MTGRSTFAIATLCAVALTACDSVKDVRQEPATTLPKQKVVVEGKVYGLGIRRSITLQNGTAAGSPHQGGAGRAREPTGARGRETRFTFGAFDDGASYNINVAPGLAPFGKLRSSTTARHHSLRSARCTQGSPAGHRGGVLDDTAVNRYDIKVQVPAAFAMPPAPG